MKKIIAAIGLLMIVGTSMADTPSTYLDLHTPVRWYADALRRAFFNALRSVNYGILEADEIWKSFYSHLNAKDGVVTISPAEILFQCMSVYQGPNAINVCLETSIDAIRRHNNLVTKYTEAGFAALDDTSTKIQWNVLEYSNIMKEVFGDAYGAFSDPFYGYMQSVNDMASLGDIRTECESILRDDEIARRLNADSTTCQRFIEAMAKIHNQYKRYYTNEQIIGVNK